MKKLLATAFFALIGAGAFAQTSPGTIVVSGAVGISKTTQDNNPMEVEQFNFKLAPSVGYLIKNGLELGATLGFNHVVAKQEGFDGMGFGTYESTTNTFSFTPYILKYFMLSEKAAFTGRAFAGVSVGTGKINFDSDFGSNADLKINGLQVGVAPGLTFFPTEKIAISSSFGSLGYNETTMGPKGS